MCALILLFFVPESPIHLLRKEKIQSAENICMKIYGTEYDVQTHLAEAKLSLESNNEKSCHILEIFKRPEIFQPFLIILGLSFIQQFSGMSVLRSYVVKIFDNIFHREYEDITKSCEIAGEAYLAAVMTGITRKN